ncbi:putative secreted effector protein [Blumeria graminis f. sp. tritici 96224]|uniref:BgtE-5979 n=1 Tax=Blumeria graminis f. sp. tritici 96224 TaxID=1268274 RepID=A0A381LHR4_BLUGR|nr:putative secreted effector protein [Blumeria graminis f. sp. tritici 96224]
MNFFHKAITAVILLLTTPAMSMMPMRDGSTGYPVPVQDHRLWFSCRGVNYENEYLFRVLNHAYGLMSSFATYPVPTERVIYERRGPYYLFPLLQNKQIYDLGKFTFSNYQMTLSQLKSRTRYYFGPLFDI